MTDEWTLKPPASDGGDGNSEGGKREFPLIPDNTMVEAEFVALKKVEKPFKDDNGVPVVKVEFRFRITDDGPYKNQNVWGETSTNFVNHPDCRMTNWVKGILGVADLPKNFSFDPDTLVSNPATIVVGVRTWSDGSDHNFVADVIPSRTVALAMASLDPEPF